MYAAPLAFSFWFSTTDHCFPSFAVGDAYGSYLGSLHHSGHSSPYTMGSQYGSALGVGGPLSPGGGLGAYVQPATSTDDLYLLELGFPPRPPKTKKIKRLKSGDPAGQAKRKSREGKSRRIISHSCSHSRSCRSPESC